MKFSARLVDVGLPLLLASFLVAGCGNDKGGSADTPAGKFKEGMLDLSERMVKIAEGIKTPQDAEKAEPEIGKIMDEVVVLLNDIMKDVDTMTEAERKEFDTIINDPELKASNDKMIAQMDKLRSEHPDAAAKLEEVMRRQSEKMGQAMEALARKMQEKMGGGMQQPAPPDMNDSTIVPPDAPTGDSAVADTLK